MWLCRKKRKKLFVKCKVTATKSYSVMCDEKVEMVLIYWENYTSLKIGSVSYCGLKRKLQVINLILQNLSACKPNI